MVVCVLVPFCHREVERGNLTSELMGSIESSLQNALTDLIKLCEQHVVQSIAAAWLNTEASVSADTIAQ